MKQTLSFYKYQGTGNDFIMVDNRDRLYQLSTEQIAFLCDRRFGIGADGLILLEPFTGMDFKMVYYNADGKESSMCGNGGRCILQFAHDLGIVGKQASFMAIDGQHEGTIEEIVHLHMKNVEEIKNHQEHYTLNTGSPHYVIFMKDIDQQDLIHIGRKIRYSADFPEGINVNLVEQAGQDSIKVRTYERGVEDETLSCGTGVVASALCFYMVHHPGKETIRVETKGGLLEVNFKPVAKGFENIYLHGPAKMVFSGSINL